ncbi:MAG: hypothetical protein H6901_06795 [Rhodobacteraceae bacterium]|nr:hypothetical protein [Paracoccaceae bacterium]MCP5341906.1 hypothetical protein [Paracoccaceae bacterium]
MIIIAAFLLGATVGWVRAARRNGNRLDKLQYAAGHAIFFAVAGLFATLVIGRLA